MTPDAYAQEWQVLTRFLPEDWREQARLCGAIRWEKGITDAELLLRLLLLHTATGLSLKSTAARARAQGLAKISHVALFKRLRNSGPWLARLARDIFSRTRFMRSRQVGSGRVVRAVDATTVEEPGARGTDWRLHYSVTLPELTCDFLALTTPKGAETFERIPVSEGDILIGDRGYCHRKAVAHVVNKRADVIVRLNLTNFPLLQRDRQPFDILAHLRGLDGLKPHSWPVRFKIKGKRYRARLCAVRRSEVSAERARSKLLKTARKKSKEVAPATSEAAGYIFVLTTAPARELPLRDVMELYRARWQVELVFKRLKSLLKLGALPKTTDPSARAWLQGKLLTALLVERLAETARLFSPWGHDEAWREVETP